ncbi:MAG TPA: asparagine synthase C-terminal domain-containing protein [Allosphingosinicella sp.]|nr:asparagine synthase C-terminal domain-containing protein [Allosphingosinicella sp.]
MAGLFLVQTRDRAFADAAMAGAREQFARHGFGKGTEREFAGWRLLHAPYALGGPETFHAKGEEFVAVAGTLTCDGRMGQAALEALLGMDAPDWDRLGGQFVALVHRAGRTRLFTDYFGAFQLFHDAGMRLFSTSLLSAVQALPRVSFDPQGVYEFAFNVVPIGDDTVFRELKTLGPDRIVTLGKDGASVEEVRKPLPDAQKLPLEDRIAAHRDRLMAVVGDHVRQFGDRIYCPLSGGLDSRLVLAALRAAGSTPNIYVYGGEDSADVRIAREIAAAQGFQLDWLDKEAWRTFEPDEFPEQVARNFEAYDALPNYGELFENGANAMAREARHKDGALSVSGGCGEIFRNFFFLPDRRFSAAAVTRTFYARYVRGDVTDAFDERAFLRGLEDKILVALDHAGDRSRLPRPLIEQIYPRIRCRAVFGREISLEARCGAYLMPFLDHRVVGEAMKLPLALKNAGRFEAALLDAIDPALARLPSAYGHDFAGPPDFRHRFGEWSTRLRPVALRQRSYALRRRMGPVADEHGGLLTPDYMGRVVDLDYPAMRRFFRTERIADSGMMRRIANLEYLAARLGSRLVA